MQRDEVRSVQLAAVLIGVYERRGKDALTSLIFSDTDATDAEQEQRTTEAFLLYGTAAARLLSRLRNQPAVVVLNSVEPVEIDAISGPIDWISTIDLMKRLESGTPLRSLRNLTLDSAQATGFAVALALTREMAKLEGKSVVDIAEEISASVESWGGRHSIFDNAHALAATLTGATQYAERHLRRTTCRLLIECFQTAGSRLLAASGRIRRSEPSEHSAPYGYGDDRVAALGYLCLSVSSLGAAIIELAERNTNATATLLCRLLDTEFLIWGFGADDRVATDWLQSSQRQNGELAACDVHRIATGTFRSQDAGIPCTINHQLTPTRLRELVAGVDPMAAETGLSELIHHAASAWGHMIAAVGAIADEHRIDPDTLVMDIVADRVSAAVDQWRRKDVLRHEVST